MKTKFFILCLIIFAGKGFSQNNNYSQTMPDSLKKVVILKPTGKTVNGLPEMAVLQDTSTVHETVMNNINNSIVDEFLELYFIAQIYLKNKNKSDAIEPAYLALTEDQGGFARVGFAIREGTSHIIKENTPYVDIVTGAATANTGRLMSFTQLYPHELGHVIFNLLSPEDTINNNAKSVGVHYFPIVTDYSTAFDEGFAIHCENVARIFEKNETIKSGIFSDIDGVAKASKQSINGFERDLIYPFRLGYYRASMLVWYSGYENYRRYKQAINGDIRYKNGSLQLRCIKDRLSYHKSGVRLNKSEKRNIVQMHSTEGAVSSFFTHLSKSELPENYLDFSFYKDFLYNPGEEARSPQELFSHLQNQFIKYFYVLQNYVVLNNSTKSQLIDFMEGYIESFPSEKNRVKEIFKDALGLEYSRELPPPLWLLIKDHSHRVLVFDLFDVITVPIYTFDLNAAEIEHLLTIDGITRNDAEKIVRYRNENGFFTDLEQLKNIPNITPEVVDKISSAKFDQDYYDKVYQDFELELNIGKLILKPLQYLFYRASFYYLIIFGLVYFFLIKRGNPTVKESAILFVKYFFFWMIFLLAGLISVLLFNQAYFYIIIFSMLMSLLALVIYRKKKERRLRTLVFIGVMSIAIIASVI